SVSWVIGDDLVCTKTKGLLGPSSDEDGEVSGSLVFPIYHQLPESHGPAVALWRLEAAELGVQSLVVFHLLRECSRDFLTQFGSLRDDEYVLVTVEGQLPQRETDRHDACLSMSGRYVEEEPSMG